MKIRWTLIACLALMTSCGKEIPSDIIQPETMEQILYDYHLSMSMTQSGKNAEKEAQKNYIFQKHQVTEELFDSSMVWYTRESQELMAIYEHLDKRFKREYSHIERLLESREEANTRTSASGDTVNVWRKGDIHWFNTAPLNKLLAFEINADTTFHERDAFLWNVDYHFFKEGKILMGMNVVYDNDSVLGMTKLVENSGPQSIYLHTDSAFKIKALNGFIQVADDTLANEPKVLAHHISLTRYHMPEPADSLSTAKKEKPEAIESKPAVREEKVKEEAVKKDEMVKPQSVSDKRKPRNARTIEEVKNKK